MDDKTALTNVNSQPNKRLCRNSSLRRILLSCTISGLADGELEAGGAVGGHVDAAGEAVEGVFAGGGDD